MNITLEPEEQRLVEPSPTLPPDDKADCAGVHVVAYRNLTQCGTRSLHRPDFTHIIGGQFGPPATFAATAGSVNQFVLLVLGLSFP
jgi:hypothetical protein